MRIAPRVLADVLAERQRQQAKWGVQNHQPLEWLAILGEEVGEACRAAVVARFSPDFAADLLGVGGDYRTELVHVAAVAISMLESYDRQQAALEVG